ncbi:hypothetical protein [Arhodomonas sp. AD133]|uniref:hypothetical protein n=1 Tax=Arhodomonas sp. AD133 TaxID=3415009 RepID=UPI003EC087C3
MPRHPGNRTRVPTPRRKARARLWQSMRVLRVFDTPSLCATAEAGADNAKRYVRALERVGVVRLQRPRQSGVKGGHAVHRLIRDLGPHAPRVQTDGRVWDPNADQLLETIDE